MREILRLSATIAFAVLCSSASAVSMSGLDGDYNNDGVVDAIDYAVWRDNLGSSVALPNDPTPDAVDANDFNLWRANYGAVADIRPPPAVPGPGDPAITFTLISSADPGRFEYRVDVHKNSNVGAMAVELAIFAPVGQMDFMGFPIDTSVDANSLNGVQGYNAAADTWYNIINWPSANPGASPFAPAPLIGFNDFGSGGPLFIAVGSEPTSATTIELLHLVILQIPVSQNLAAAQTGPELGTWSALIAGGGVLYATGGTINAPVPVPPPVLLMALPAILMMRRRTWRRTGS